MDWVALEPFVDEDTITLYEEGGIYQGAQGSFASVTRPLNLGEHVAVCPRCGQRFATTDHGTAELHRDRHLDGDEEAPSICHDRISNS
jgi:hypothetical protein